MDSPEWERKGRTNLAATETAQRIAGTTKAWGVQRFGLKYSSGTLSHEKLMNSKSHPTWIGRGQQGHLRETRNRSRTLCG